MSDSDDDYELPNLAERIQASYKIQNKLKFSEVSDSDDEDSGFLKSPERNLNTFSSAVKLKSVKTPDSENEDAEVLKFSERIRNTPSSTVKFKIPLSSESENEESEILKFSERIRNTPRSHCKLKPINDDSDSDGTFSNLITKYQDLHTSKSQNKYSAQVLHSLPPSEKSRLSSSTPFSSKTTSACQETPRSRVASQSENEKEYASLFPSRSDSSLFCKKRTFYAQKLFEFFNKKIFDYQLPKDLPLIWDELLVKTAGLTVCSRKNKVYSCSIKLSPKLLTSFDRLQDTLLHEMCHAAVWLLNKVNVAHGPIWQIWASRCKLILPFIACPERCHTYDVPYRFWYQCTNCDWKRGACRRIKKYHGAMCKRCKTAITMTVNN